VDSLVWADHLVWVDSLVWADHLVWVDSLVWAKSYSCSTITKNISELPYCIKELACIMGIILLLL
jgi:hypothetical protein